MSLEIQEAKAFELKPGHKYLLVFDRRSLTMNDVATLTKWVKDIGCEAVAVGLGEGVADMKLVDLADMKLVDLTVEGVTP